MRLIFFNDKTFILIYIIIVFIVIPPLQICSQTLKQASVIPDTIHVRIDNISINELFFVRRLNADFSYPAISTISVVDNQDNTVPELTDTLHWLASDDIIPNGLCISEIWPEFLKYHLDNSTIPEDPNLNHLIPAPLIIVVRKTILLPTNAKQSVNFSFRLLNSLTNKFREDRLNNSAI